MLQRVHLENFKALKNLDLDLAKVTVLTGFNSTGKTSVIQSLAFIKQSLQRKEISYNDYLLRLGDYREVVHGHDASLPIRIDATLDDGAGDMTYSLETTPEGVEEAFLRNGQSEWSWNSKKEGVIEASGRLFFPLAAGGYGGGSYTTEDYAGTNAAQKVMMKWFEDALYLSSNRGFTRYNYPLLAGNPTIEDISNRAGDASLIMYRLNEAKRFPEMQSRLDVMAKRLSMLGVEVSPYVTNGPSIVVDLVEGDMWVSAVNSGYGVNQSVATVVLGSLSPEGSLVMIEEPETHLHPRFQRKMAEIVLGMAQESRCSSPRIPTISSRRWAIWWAKAASPRKTSRCTTSRSKAARPKRRPSICSTRKPSPNCSCRERRTPWQSPTKRRWTIYGRGASCLTRLSPKRIPSRGRRYASPSTSCTRPS